MISQSAENASKVGSLLRERGLSRLIAALDGDGEEIRIVGGAVRDALMGYPIGDIDLATTATPEETMRRAQAADFKVVPTGVAHGTVTIVIDGRPFEVTTLREDVETDGRHAIVKFGRDFEADARRRDFTINALSCDPDGKIYDYVGGLDDLAARKVRFIGEPRQRIREDYLRVIRFFRFHAARGGGVMDRAALDACIAERAGLDTLSRERVRAEMIKMMAADGVATVAGDMSDCGILGRLTGGVATPQRLTRVIAIEAARGLPHDPILRLGALCVAIEEDATRLGANWRLSNAERDRLAHMAAALTPLHGCGLPPGPGILREILFVHGRRAARDAAILAQAESGAPPESPQWISAWRFLNDTPEPRLPFSGADLLARGMSEGRGVGATLKRFQALWIRAGFPTDPQLLSQLLDEARTP